MCRVLAPARRVNIIDPRFIIGKLSSHSALGAHADAHFWPHSSTTPFFVLTITTSMCEIRIVGRKMAVTELRAAVAGVCSDHPYLRSDSENCEGSPFLVSNNEVNNNAPKRTDVWRPPSKLTQRLSVAVQYSAAQEVAEALGLSVAADPRAAP